uniref:Uncharacterized protein n=1 Tax=Lepeophtheirus salmonis TaxID=72036 RepID=A0A0K2TIM3_LEPSM
MLAIKEVLSWI